MTSNMGLAVLEMRRPKCNDHCITAADLGHQDEGAEDQVVYPHKDCPVHRVAQAS